MDAGYSTRTQETGNNLIGKIMKINFKKDFVDCFGNPIEEKIKGNVEHISIDRRLATSLFSLSNVEGRPLNGDEKYMAYSISCRMAQTPESVELTTEEASFLKKVCSELLSAGAYGQVYDLIEGNNN